MLVKEAKRVIPEEQIEQQGINLAKSLFVQPTPWQNPLDEIGIYLKKDEALGVATIASMQSELELVNVPNEQRRKIATAIAGKIIRGRLNGIFPIGSSVALQRTEIDNIELYHRSDIDKESAKARYTAYKELLDVAIAEKRRPLQNKRAREEDARRTKREKERLARQAERESPPIAVLNFISYSSGTPEKELQSKVAIVKEALKKGGKDGGFLVKEISDPTHGFEDKSARLLAPEMVDRILEKGLTPEQFEVVVATARDKVVEAIRSMEAYADEAAMQILADIGKIMRTASGKNFVLPISIQRSIAPLLYAHLSYFRGVDSPYFKDETNFIVEADFGPFYSNSSYVNGFIHRFALRFATKMLEGHQDMLEERSQEPEAAFLLRVLNQNNYGDIIALKQGAAVEVEGKIILLADLDAFLAPVVFDDALITHTIFADVLGALFPLPYTNVGDGRELYLIGISKMAQMLFATEEIVQLLAPDQTDPLFQQANVEDLKNQIRAKENEVKNIKGNNREANQRKNALNNRIKELSGSLRRIYMAVEKKETRGEKIKRLLWERIPKKEPKPKDYNGRNSEAYRVALSKYRQLSKKYSYFREPDPADYEGEEASKAYSDESFLYSIFRRLSNSSKVEFMNRDSLIASFPF